MQGSNVAVSEEDKRDRVISLFQYIEELNKLKQRPVLNISEYVKTGMVLPASEIPEKSNDIYIGYEEKEAGVLLAVHRPDYKDYPEEDVLKCKTIEQTEKIFTKLYDAYFELKKNPETMEIIVADGFIRDRSNDNIDHPLLTKRVRLDYDAEKNTVYVMDSDAPTELYNAAFQNIEGINHKAVEQLKETLLENEYHPIDREKTPKFIEGMAHSLSAEGAFSKYGIPEKWKEHNKILVYLNLSFIVRKRFDGTVKAVEQIISAVENGAEIPCPIMDIVCGGAEESLESDETTLEERLAAIDGESTDILLSKAANREQLEIAGKIEKNDAVLVQGPPGTGKTHTIANLLGHFLAHGKSVLVTSYTSKALSVLKDKVPEGLQDLCVAVLEDSNKDMEKSVDGITDFMSANTSDEIHEQMERLAAERESVIRELAIARRNIFRIIKNENEIAVLDGTGYTPSKIAAFVAEHSDLEYIIPGEVADQLSFPLNREELEILYKSNDEVSDEDESEVYVNLPRSNEVLAPEDYRNLINTLEDFENRLGELEIDSGWMGKNDPEHESFLVSKGGKSFNIAYAAKDILNNLKALIEQDNPDGLIKIAVVDGINGGVYKDKWVTLVKQIKETERYAKAVSGSQFGKRIQIPENENLETLKYLIERAEIILRDKGRFPLFMNGKTELQEAMAKTTIDGRIPVTADECKLIIGYISLIQKRQLCGAYWDELLASSGIPYFESLDPEKPERIASSWIPFIESSLFWERDFYAPIANALYAMGIDPDELFDIRLPDSNLLKLDKKIKGMHRIIPIFAEMTDIYEKEAICHDLVRRTEEALSEGTRKESTLCKRMLEAFKEEDVETYAKGFERICKITEKKEFIKDRQFILEKLDSAAPEWSRAIRNRVGIHGENKPPKKIIEAWRYKQYLRVLNKLYEQPYIELQHECLRLNHEYRRITAEYAEKSAWYNLLCRTEGNLDMQQALNGWKLTVKKIGEGNGKNASALKAEARRLMSVCQKAVPAWIMPINRALENLDPGKNQFDVVIIDEASQSDISSLAILFMGKKLIIVGDDKQVSPMAIGVETEKIENLKKLYIDKKIPNAHLYDGTTSIYDIASTTFQPLMLTEHFRCVPDIIGFSNMLSYDNKIKPLREAGSSKLIPAVIDYKVPDGKRTGKVNRKEAECIVRLMKECISKSEYKGKTMGIISLLGDDQAKIIQTMISREIDPLEVKNRNILCGNASNFQGDERDVVFLSMVDSPDEAGSLPRTGFGAGDAFRKRYNVAVSRAKDQLWIVNSLEARKDLKPGDIRRQLLEYAENPSLYEIKYERNGRESDSEFVVEVAKRLLNAGFNVIQQYEVGTYKLDIVVASGKKMAAIECDGERPHSSDSMIRDAMEKQSILERLGWKFIRIRGCEYYRDEDATIEKIIAELRDAGF
ncbi:Protein of unknown function [Lachnospiraceae bacterium KH1T2]|nr:Protein of unknown function [Lachnospiraceae bacterium KH1T2]